MTESTQIPILLPLAIGVGVFVCTIFIHALPLSAAVNFLRRERRLGHVGANYWNDFAIVAMTISFTLIAHLIEIALWAALFVVCGAFPQFGSAFYHSAGNYTSLGYGDLIMSPSWRLLGPLEAANGMLMFGVSTAMIFAVIQWLIQVRFADLRK
jgi:Ion channel